VKSCWPWCVLLMPFATSGLLTMQPTGQPVTASVERIDKAELVRRLDAGEITSGWTFGPGILPKPTVDVGYDSDDGRFGVYGVGGSKSMVLLYMRDEVVYGACAYGLSAGRQEVWWFCDEELLAKHVVLAAKRFKVAPAPKKP
jgi:hypothetical protein